MRIITLIAAIGLVAADQHLPATTEVSTTAEDTRADFQAFTGKVTREKVRLRLQPSVDCPIITELKKGDLLVIVGETDDFYAVLPPSYIKGYVYRTFILDNVVEGSHVNVRLEPQLEAPVIAQLNRGDRIEGHVASTNSKWLEIAPPATAHFFVSRDYIENIGHAELINTLSQRKAEVEHLLASAIVDSENELAKSFEAIDLTSTWETYRKIAADYNDFTVETAQAAESLKKLQDTNLERKIAYLEEKHIQHEAQQQITEEHPEKQEPQQAALDQPAAAVTVEEARQHVATTTPIHIAAWKATEDDLYRQWRRSNSNSSRAAYEDTQVEMATTLVGTLEPYHSSAKNKPGDFIMRNRHNQRVAYLYSYDADLNLQDYVGRNITMRVVARPNHRFALPAYRVLAIESKN
jgi:hypothetical protein